MTILGAFGLKLETVDIQVLNPAAVTPTIVNCDSISICNGQTPMLKVSKTNRTRTCLCKPRGVGATLKRIKKVEIQELRCNIND